MTTLTRSQYESLAVDECGPWMEAAGMAVTTAGANSSLNAPLRKALAAMGSPPVDPTLVADSDLAAVDADADLEEFTARLTLAILETCQSRLANVDGMLEGMQSLESPRMKVLATLVESRHARLIADYGVGLAAGSSVSAGAIGLGSLADDECEAP
jgi:hypothetical protein